MVNETAVEKNVEAALMSSRIFRRRPGDVPYPVEHAGASSSTFDIWNIMFQRSYFKGLTMHQFNDRHPAVVLDLGCGSGYWAIEAAKEWKNSTIVGYDIRNIQPRLFAFEQHKDIAHRVKWVHGNLLDGLPFSSNHFNFVRIANIGLGVPEDEWQFVFEEVARVMKSGGIIEVIEEDPIFPCTQRVAQIWPPPVRNTIYSPSLGTPPSSALSSNSSVTAVSDNSWTPTQDERFEYSTSKSAITSNTHLSGNESLQHLSYIPRAPSISEPDRTPDLRDHSKLKAAWDAMLTSRFIASKPLSVLPFYLSFSFTDVKMRPPLKVTLPPNSVYKRRPSSSKSSTQSSADSNSYPATVEPSNTSTWCTKSESNFTVPTSPRETCMVSSATSSGPTCTSWANVHLASTVHKIVGCKEAIWQEYRKLFETDIQTFVTHGEMSTNSCTRESFDDEWLSWKHDMTDRIGMRSEVITQFQWPELGGDRPGWRNWRSKVAKIERAEALMRLRADITGNGSHNVADNEEGPQLCRSMRGFVAWKP